MRSRISRSFALTLVLFGAVLASSTACTSRSVFRCATNDACASEDGTPGVCEQDSFCSFPDTACSESGRRYADGAGSGVASSCVLAPASTKCVADVALGTSHSCLVKTDGTVWCWGDNGKGQLGDGTLAARAAPTLVRLPAGAHATAVTAGETHTCALLGDGTVWCWGANDTHQLGAGDADSNVPVQVSFTVGDPPGTPVKVSSLSAGGKHTCAVAEKVAYCWGENSDGQCGKDPKAFDDVATPMAVDGIDGIVAPSSGDEFSCALKDDKSVWCWGANASGELGNGTVTPSSAPVKVSVASVTELSAGDETVCGLKDDGSVWCWGYGQSGGNGVGSTADQHSPVAVTTAKSIVASGQSFHTCAIQSDAKLMCWGANDSGQLGAAKTDAHVLSPVLVSLVTVTRVALGGKHSCAITLDGALWCWGANDLGQIGLGNAGGPEPSPRRVPFACGQ